MLTTINGALIEAQMLLYVAHYEDVNSNAMKSEELTIKMHEFIERYARAWKYSQKILFSYEFAKIKKSCNLFRQK